MGKLISSSFSVLIMGARIDSDDDGGGGKAISKKETRMLLAINSAESQLIDAMDREMHDSGSTFEVEKFVDVFRKYTPHFAQMMSAESSEDSDEEDERPLPKKYLPFLSAFAKTRDEFVAAIKNNYKVLCKKDLKDLNFSVFKSHPEEIFKSYDKCGGRQAKANSGAASPHQLQLNTQQTFSSFGTDEMVEYALNSMNINDSVDTDHGSLLSGQEEELRKTIESESDTPTPTIEDWNGARERRVERANDENKSRCAVPDAVPLMVPSRDNCRPLEQLPTSINMVDQDRREMNDICEKKKEEVISVTSRTSQSHSPILATGCDASIIHNSSTHHGTSAQCHGIRSIVSPSSNVESDEMCTPTRLISHSQSNSSPSNAVPTIAHSPHGSSHMNDITAEDELFSVMAGLKDAMKKVHQDVRFALPPMIERVVRAEINREQPITVKELIGVEYADDSLEQFMLKMLTMDATLMKILVLNSNDEGVNVVHLQKNISMQLKNNSNMNHGEKRGNDDRLEEIEMDHTIVPSIPERLTSIDHHQFYPESIHLPMILTVSKAVGLTILKEHKGLFAVVLSTWSSTIENQLKALQLLDIDHLSLSSERHLEKGRAVVLKSDVGEYCRGIVSEEWTRDQNGTVVKCMLIDFGDEVLIPVEVIYAFPNWTETIPPASILMTELECYPIGATLETDKFSDSEWKCIEKVLDEWNVVTIHVMSLKGNRYVMDLQNEAGESFTHTLIGMRIAKKELVGGDTVSSHLLSVDMPIPSSDEHSDPIDPIDSKTALEIEQDFNELLGSSCVEKIMDDTMNIVDSSPLNHEKVESQVGTGGTFDKQVKDTTELVSLVNENIEEDWTNMIEERHDGSDHCLPSSINVMNGSSMTSTSSLIMRKEETNIRDFLEIPSSTDIPSLLQFVAQPIPNAPPPLIGLNVRRSGLVQILDDNE